MRTIYKLSRTPDLAVHDPVSQRVAANRRVVPVEARLHVSSWLLQPPAETSFNLTAMSFNLQLKYLWAVNSDAMIPTPSSAIAHMNCSSAVSGAEPDERNVFHNVRVTEAA